MESIASLSVFAGPAPEPPGHRPGGRSSSRVAVLGGLIKEYERADRQRPVVKSQVKRYDEVMEPYRHSSGGLSNSVPGSCWHAYADLKLPGAGKEEPGKPTGLA